MKYDYCKLKGKIKEKMGTQSSLSREIGLSEKTFSLKINGKIEWRQSEIIKISNILGIKCEEIPEYFFDHEVQKFEQKALGVDVTEIIEEGQR